MAYLGADQYFHYFYFRPKDSVTLKTKFFFFFFLFPPRNSFLSFLLSETVSHLPLLLPSSVRRKAIIKKKKGARCFVSTSVQSTTCRAASLAVRRHLCKRYKSVSQYFHIGHINLSFHINIAWCKSLSVHENDWGRKSNKISFA